MSQPDDGADGAAKQFRPTRDPSGCEDETMSDDYCCCFCERLPAFRHRRWRSQAACRCPVCLARLIRTPDQIYRDIDSASANKNRVRLADSAWTVLLGAFVLTTIGVIFLMSFAKSRAVLPGDAPTASPQARTPSQPVPSDNNRPLKTERLVKTSEPPRSIESPKNKVKEPLLAVATKKPASVPPRNMPSTRKPDPPAPAVESTPTRPTESELIAAGPSASTATPKIGSHSSEELMELLKRVPVIGLTGLESPDADAKDARRQKQSDRRELERTVREHRENFLERVVLARPGMSGLPFRRGKDCTLEPPKARDLDESSKSVRSLTATIDRRADGSIGTNSGTDGLASSTPFDVYHLLVKMPGLGDPRRLPAVEQVLTGEPAAIRLGLMHFLRSPPDSPIAAALLARRAIFDTSAEVREVARDALRLLSPRDYLPALVDGLRYPWPPANLHAAEALVSLDAKATIPDLIRILDEPDPGAPFETQVDGKKVLAVRELVRMNHHANCLVCHAPSLSASDAVRAPVPSPDLPLTIRAYYGSTSIGDLFVRADVTYLRQDFSEVLPVENPGRWPKEQRFDFVVRERKLTEDGSSVLPAPKVPTDIRQIGSSQRAALAALRVLTGIDGGSTAASWTAALANPRLSTNRIGNRDAP
jgi:hypothetical protein